MKFESLNLSSKLLNAIQDMGYEKTTPAQEQALPESIQGRDLLLQSQTGTGKTGVFLITIIQRMLECSDPGGSVRALIIVPTRELAVQVDEQAQLLLKYLDYGSMAMYGGVGYDKQERQLSKQPEIVVATPGRLIDFVKSKTVDISNVSYLVVDEADRMFDMGFMPDVRWIIGKLPKKEERQTQVLSATLDTRIRRLINQYMVEPVVIEIEPDQITVDRIDQSLIHVSREEKLPTLLTLMDREQMERVIIFTNMKRTAEMLGFKLAGNGYEAEVLTGDVNQSKRLRIVEQVKAGNVKILIATDVAARGLHVDNITHVINYDLPTEAASYVHRIGRTARAGADGKAYSIACEDLVEHLMEIERYIDQKIRTEVVDGELVRDKAGAYRGSGGGSRGRGARGGQANRGSYRGKERGETGRGSASFSGRPPTGGGGGGRFGSGGDGRGKPVKSMNQSERAEYYKKKYSGGGTAAGEATPKNSSGKPLSKPKKSSKKRPYKKSSSEKSANKSGKPATAKSASVAGNKPSKAAAPKKKRSMLGKIFGALGGK